MRILLTLIIVIPFIISSCGSPQRTLEEAQADPKALAETIIYLVQNEKYDALPALVDEEADDKTKELVAIKDADETEKKQTAQYFESGSLNGEPVIDGDKATVKVNLGHKGNFEETFGMVKKDGKWHLSSSSY